MNHKVLFVFIQILCLVLALMIGSGFLEFIQKFIFNNIMASMLLLYINRKAVIESLIQGFRRLRWKSI